MTQPVNSHASGVPPTGTSRGRASDRADSRGQAEARRHQMQPLREPGDPRAREDEPVPREHNPVAEPFRRPRRTRERGGGSAARVVSMR